MPRKIRQVKQLGWEIVEDESPRILVCEGACNPNFREHDRLVRQAYAAQKSKSERRVHQTVETHLRRTLPALSRALHHTVHHPTGPGRWGQAGWTRTWQCDICGTVRIW